MSGLILIVMTVIAAMIVELFRPNITALSKIIRRKPFETFMVVAMCILIAILCKGTFL